MNYKGNIKEVFAQEPPKEWLKEITFADKKKGLYLPIGKVEFILDQISDTWSKKIKEIILINHSATVVVRVIFWIGDKMYWQEGAATILIGGDVTAQTAVPIAESMAVKDACECWGTLFGRDLNRGKDLALDVPKSDLEVIIELFKEVIGKMPKVEAEAVGRIITNEEVKSYGKVLKVLNKYVGVPENQETLKTK